MNVPDVAHLELGTTLAGVKRHVSELRVKKFLTLICCMAASLLFLVALLHKPRVLQAFQRSETFSANVSHSTVLVQRWRRARCVARLVFTWLAEVFTLRDSRIFSDDRDLLDIIMLLNQVRHGFFTAVFFLPPAATWSRLRNSEVPGQPPLRSRQCPLGLTTLSPESRSKVRVSNFSLEVASWFAEQILRSPQSPTFFPLVFPEDFRERQPYRSSITLVCTRVHCPLGRS